VSGQRSLSAILFDGVTTRHALLDGNERLSWQSLTLLLDTEDGWPQPANE